VPADEDGDGAIDEGCAWNFGTPHAMPAPMGVAWEKNLVTPSWISPDGLRLYVTYRTDFGRHGAVHLITRASRLAPFGAPVPVAGLDLGNFSVTGFTLSSDEREAYFEAEAAGAGQTDIYRATRASRDGQFSALARVDALSSDGNDERPALRVDGREILLAQGRRLYRAVRASTDEPFGAAEPLRGIPDGDVNSPSPSLDGRSIVYYAVASGTFRLFRAERSDVASATFGDPVEIVSAEPSGAHEVFTPVLSETTHELFFASSQPWSPTYYALWRIRICRDAGCVSDPIPCAGVRSPDGMHCYTKLASTQSWSAAETLCTQNGGHLATISSQAEQDLVWSRFGGEGLWIGAYDDRGTIAECNSRGIGGAVFPCAFGWESGEAWTFSRWFSSAAVAEPEEGAAGQDCGALWRDPTYDGMWADIACSETFRAVCESVAIPTW
jgi:hypothetical protein